MLCVSVCARKEIVVYGCRDGTLGVCNLEGGEAVCGKVTNGAGAEAAVR